MNRHRIQLTGKKYRRQQQRRKLGLVVGIVGLVVLVLVFIIGFSAVSPAAPTAIVSLPATADARGADQQAQVLALLNDLRAQQGLGSIRSNALLTRAALTHSLDMAQNDFMAHDGSDGSQPADRATTAGYSWQAVGENVLLRPNIDATGAFSQWVNSPPHLDNMLDPVFDEVGIAHAVSNTGTVYYTMLLGSAR